MDCLSLACLLVAAVVVATTEEAVPPRKVKLSVSFKVPSSAEKAAITEVRQVGKELWVRVDVKGGGDIGLAVISTTHAEVEIDAPALPVKYLVFGKTWGWKNEEKGLLFLRDLDAKEKEKLEKAFEGGNVFYKAKK